jgi:hypothetical protein
VSSNTLKRSLGDRMREARRQALVGREEEQKRFRELLDSGEPAIVWLHAPGGTGKSTLVREWMEVAADAGVATALVDLHTTPATPGGIQEALAASVGIQAEALAARLMEAGRFALFFDTWERGITCDGWMREALMPSLPETAVVMIASREPPTPAWTADPGLRSLLREMPLPNLSADAAKALLAQHGVAEEQHEQLIAVTHGHPLALTLVAQIAEQSPDQAIKIEEEPELLGALMDRFVRRVPSDDHRETLRICARARFTTETILRALLPHADASALFDWLRSLPFITESPFGLRPHALARDVIDGDYRWRDPEAYAELHWALSRALLDLVRNSEGPAQLRLFHDLLYLGRIDPLLHDFYEFEELGSGWGDRAHPEDREALIALATECSGEKTAKILDYWLTRQRQAFLVVRSPLGVPTATACHLLLSTITDEDRAADPAMPIIAEQIEEMGGLAPGELALVTRLYVWKRGDAPALKLRNNTPQLLCLTVPKIVVVVSMVPMPQFWLPLYRRAGFTRVPQREKRVGEGLGFFIQDWRRTPIDRWAEEEVTRQLLGATAEELSDPETTPRLTRQQVEDATRAALKNFTRPAALAENPLLEFTDSGDPTELTALLDDALATLTSHPKDQKLHRALTLTYFKPAPTQEIAAERLSLPFSTYRRHLTKGVERVVEWMWQRRT